MYFYVYGCMHEFVAYYSGSQRLTVEKLEVLRTGCVFFSDLPTINSFWLMSSKGILTLEIAKSCL